MQGWLRRVGRVAPDDLTAERVQKHRYDWLDMLEKEFMRYAIAECFKKAKKKLRMPDGKRGEVYICLAILETNCSRFVKPAAKAVIEGRMGFSDFSPALEYWLNSKGHAAPWECTQKTMQTYRHAWLDALIEEFGG